MALKHIARLHNNNCVSCLLWPLFFFDVSTVIAFRCTHSRVAINRNFSVSKIRLLLSSLMICGLTSYSVEIGGRFQTATSMETKILTMAHLWFVLTQLSTFLFNIFLRRKTVQIFDGYQRLLDDRFKIKTLLSGSDAKAIRKRGLLHVVFAVCISATVLVKTKTCWDSSRSPDGVLVFFGAMSLTLNVFQSLNEILLNYFLQHKINCNIKNALKWKFSNLEDELKLSRQFYGNLRRLMGEIGRIYGPRFLIWYLGVLIVGIFNCFMLVLNVFYDGGFSASDLPVFMETAAATAIALYFSYAVQKMDDVTDEILTFLFQFRVASLTHAEGLQLESLMVAMNVHRSTIRVMDIYTIGTKVVGPVRKVGLFSPIQITLLQRVQVVGILITYVLVVLQFYSAK